MHASLFRMLTHPRPRLIDIDQSAVDTLTRIVDRHAIIEGGRVVWTGTSAALAAAPEGQHRYLSV